MLLILGTPKDVFSQVEKLRDLGLDVPQSTELLYELKKDGMEFPSGIVSVEECAEAIMNYYQNNR